MKFVPRLSTPCGIEVPIVRVLLAWEGDPAGRQANARLAPRSARSRGRSRGPEDVAAVSIARIYEERDRRAPVPCGVARGIGRPCSGRACLVIGFPRPRVQRRGRHRGVGVANRRRGTVNPRCRVPLCAISSPPAARPRTTGKSTSTTRASCPSERPGFSCWILCDAECCAGSRLLLGRRRLVHVPGANRLRRHGHRTLLNNLNLHGFLLT